MGLWSSGMTSHSHCGGGSSILPRSTKFSFKLDFLLCIIQIILRHWYWLKISEQSRLFLKIVGGLEVVAIALRAHRRIFARSVKPALFCYFFLKKVNIRNLFLFMLFVSEKYQKLLAST